MSFYKINSNCLTNWNWDAEDNAESSYVQAATTLMVYFSSNNKFIIIHQEMSMSFIVSKPSYLYVMLRAR